MNLNHLHFGAYDLQATQRFYENYFGFKLHRQLGKSVVLINDEHFLLAMDPIDGEGEQAKQTLPLHFGFCVNTPQTVNALYERMNNEGVLFAQPLKQISPNALSFYCFDPVGNRIEVGWYKTL